MTWSLSFSLPLQTHTRTFHPACLSQAATGFICSSVLPCPVAMCLEHKSLGEKKKAVLVLVVVVVMEMQKGERGEVEQLCIDLCPPATHQEAAFIMLPFK